MVRLQYLAVMVTVMQYLQFFFMNLKYFFIGVLSDFYDLEYLNLTESQLSNKNWHGA